MTIRIVTDSTCDLPADLAAAHGITVLPMYINIGDRSYLDGVELTRAEFYERLPGYNPPPTTASAGPEHFRQAYERLAAQGASEILSIHVAASFSAVCNAATAAAREVQGLRVTVFDSQQVSLGLGFLAVTAARALAAGQPLADVLAALSDQIKRTYIFAALDTLEFLRRSGRVNDLVARLGGLLQIKPLLKVYQGVISSERVRTRSQAVQRVVGWLAEQAPLEHLAVLHTRARERADELLGQVRHLVPPGDVLIVEVTPTIGTHVGPDCLGFACVRAR
jgi:DegV family protein with EDD domain